VNFGLAGSHGGGITSGMHAATKQLDSGGGSRRGWVKIRNWVPWLGGAVGIGGSGVS